MRPRHAVPVLCFLALAPLRAQEANLVPNPLFAGDTGVVAAIGGTVLVDPAVPEFWRAFAVSGGDVELELEPWEDEEIFDGSPATLAACLRVNAFGSDQGFDNDNGRFPVVPGVSYHGEFWARSGNDDGSDQGFQFGFPLFGPAGNYLQREPGGAGGLLATEDWQLFAGPSFSDAEAAMAHISWRVIDDGGENRICIALPSVIGESDGPVPPSNLRCQRRGNTAELTWQNNGEYELLRVERDGETLAELPPDATTFTDVDLPVGTSAYRVVAEADGLEDGPACEVSRFELEVGAAVRVDLGELDIEEGLAATFFADNTDGETEFAVCGPDEDLREARTNLGGADNDHADVFFYFTVTDPALKSQSGLRVTATVFDDPDLFGAGLFLQYTNERALAVDDLANTFFRDGSDAFLEGTGEWIEVSWELGDAGFRSFQQGTADFRIGVAGGGQVCIDAVEVTFRPAPRDVTCRNTGAGVALTWENAIEFDSVAIVRDGEEIAELPGDSTSFEDLDVDEGTHLYSVLGRVGEFEAGGSCSSTVFLVDPGISVSVDLGEADVTDGLENSQRLSPSDGENEPAECAEGGEGRRNLAAGDDDFPDAFFYFNVLDPAVKAQSDFLLAVTVFDDPALAGTALSLQFTRRGASGPADIPNTFFPLESPPARTLQGTGEWVTLEWDIEDAGFASYQQGTSDFRIGVGGGASLCVDRVELSFVSTEVPGGPLLRRGDANADGAVDLADPVGLLAVLFLGEGSVPCEDAADANDDSGLDLTDSVTILGHLFLGAGELPAPGTAVCGEDPTADGLGCESYPPCE